MATSNGTSTAVQPPRDLLGFIRDQRLLADAPLKLVRERVKAGVYPEEATALAKHLVADRFLSEFQARALLQGRGAGLVIGRYVILDLIGKGGMGRVYRARHTLLGRTVALKIIDRKWLARPQSVARALREIRIAGRLDHPNIVRALDADQVEGVPYIAMEYLPGQDLEQRLRDLGPMPPEDVVRYAVDAASGLSHAHQRGIVHRDIKPSNLFLGMDGRVRVLDLGLGILFAADEPGEAPFATAAGSAVGTVEFMSPEQAAEGRVDGRSDLFSLGCTAYYLLTGRVPFPAKSRIESLARRIHDRADSIERWRPDLPRDLVELLDRLMARRPEDRIQSAAEAAESFRALWLRFSNRREHNPWSDEASRSSDVASLPNPPSSESPSQASLPLWHEFLIVLARYPRLAIATALAIPILSFIAGIVLARLLG